MNDIFLIEKHTQDADSVPVIDPQCESVSGKEECYNFARLLAGSNYCIYHYGLFSFYNGLYHDPDLYNGDGVKIILGQLAAQYNIQPSTSNINAIYAQLKISAVMLTTMPNPSRYILYQNTLLDTVTQNMCTPTPVIFNTGCITANFDRSKSGQHPVFDAFLDEASMGDCTWKERAWQLIGYALSTDTSAKRIFFFVGASNTGKTILAQMLMHLITPSLSCSLSLDNLCNHHFSASELYGKRICVSGDEEKNPIGSKGIALLKTLSGHDYVTSDRKNRGQITFSPTAKLVICSNHNIHTTIASQDPSFQGRIFVLPFMNPIPVDKQDPYLLEKILSERDAIVTDAFYHYRKLVADNYCFAGDGGNYEKGLTFLNGNMPYDELEDFLHTACVYDEEAFTPTEILYKAFMEKHPGCFKDNASFSRAVSNLNQNRNVYTIRKRTEYGNLRGFNGIRLRDHKEVTA